MNHLGLFVQAFGPSGIPMGKEPKGRPADLRGCLGARLELVADLQPDLIDNFLGWPGGN